MIYMVKYNFQGDNINFKKKFNAWWQCFSTSIWMLLGYLTDRIDGTDDVGLSKYLDDVEDSIGKPGIGEKIKRKYNWITGRSSLWWLVQQAGLQQWANDNGVKGKAVFRDKVWPFEELDTLLERYGPVVLQTTKMGGLPGGHIILVIGCTPDSYIVNDPAGNATSNYKDRNGSAVSYSKSYLKKYTGRKIRCIYWDNSIIGVL